MNFLETFTCCAGNLYIAPVYRLLVQHVLVVNFRRQHNQSGLVNGSSSFGKRNRIDLSTEKMIDILQSAEHINTPRRRSFFFEFIVLWSFVALSNEVNWERLKSFSTSSFSMYFSRFMTLCSYLQLSLKYVCWIHCPSFPTVFWYIISVPKPVRALFKFSVLFRHDFCGRRVGTGRRRVEWGFLGRGKPFKFVTQPAHRTVNMSLFEVYF